MIPTSKGFLNRFKMVKIPSVREMFVRTGNVPAPINQVDLEKLGTLAPRKNDLVEQIEEYADQVPVNDPDNPSD